MLLSTLSIHYSKMSNESQMPAVKHEQLLFMTQVDIHHFNLPHIHSWVGLTNNLNSL